MAQKRVPSTRPANPSTHQDLRVLATGGGGFALMPVPDLMARPGDAHHLMDVELLSPDRLVRYLGRSVSRMFLVALADLYLRCAADPYPEQSVPSVEDARSGVAITVVGSSQFLATIEYLVIPDLEADVREQDGVAVDIARSTLVTASHALNKWLERNASDTERTT